MHVTVSPPGRQGRLLAVLFTVAALLAAPAAVAQNPTGTLTGTVLGPDGEGMPGVTVTATSPKLQGERIVVTGPNGGYKLAFLPPGDYRLAYELDSFATLTRDVKISAAVPTSSDVTMQLAAVEETIEVTGQQAAISETGTGSTTITQDEVNVLPINRDLDSVVTLTAGVHATGPRGANADQPNLTIAGAMSFENLWTLNGVVINENVRGQELPLFIEDAIQETTTQVSGISAEYGRFQGGVINAITKSGGNEFSGSFRVNLTNDDWEETTPLSAEPEDNINESLEATLGGYLWKDHLWFFAAGRDEASEERASLPLTNLPVDRSTEQTRYEAKLTGSLADSHTVVASFLEIDQSSTGSFFSNSIDPRSVTDREDPQEISSLNYTGILNPRFFVEAQYSEREFQIGVGSGAKSRTLEEGTLMRTNSGPWRYYTATFCGVCEQEERNNENLLAKGSWFASTESLGTHDLVFGYDTFSDIRFSVNHQTGSDFTVWDSEFVLSGNDIFPVIYPCVAGGQGCETTSGENPGTFDETVIGWFPVYNLDAVQPTDFQTNSIYVNDRWQLDSNWAFNVGARYDTTSGTNGGGVEVLDDERISPRLGLTWDVHGNGDLVAHANYGTYVASPTNTIADSTSSGGAIGVFQFLYGGPAINTQCGAGGPCTPTRDVLSEIFGWYLANGGTTDITGDLSNLPNVVFVNIPGATSEIRGTLESPAADEIALGVTKRLGGRGLVRADLVRREYGDFYSDRTDLGTGAVSTPQGLADLTLVGNYGDGILEREYLGLHVQARYRLTPSLSLAATYALSELEGNINGETAAAGPVPSSPRSYPEYHQVSWAYPVGNLDSDQTHKLSAWMIYDVLDSEHHSLSVSVLQTYQSGQHYSLFGAVNTNRYVQNPGYETPPSSINYFFGGRGSGTFDDVTSTDLSLNYAFQWNAFGRQVEVYLQPEMRNVFDEDGLLEFDTRIHTADLANSATACNGAPCQRFNPFTETPVEGVHWAKRATFGEPLAEDDFQAPREFRFSVGFRF